MKYRMHVKVLLKNGVEIDQSNTFESDDESTVIQEVFEFRKFMEQLLRKTGEDGGKVTDGIVNAGSWQIDAMEMVAASVNLYSVDKSDEGPYALESLVEVPMP